MHTTVSTIPGHNTAHIWLCTVDYSTINIVVVILLLLLLLLPDPATPTVAAPAPMYFAAWSMSRHTVLVCISLV